MGKVYAIVHNGKVSNHYSWDSCKKEVRGLSGAKYKGFNSELERDQWVQGQLQHTASLDDILKAPENRLIYYVDGSYRPKIRADYAGWGVAVAQGNNFIDAFHGYTPDVCKSRNIDGEIYAAYQALLYIADHAVEAKEHIIVHDYMGISQWIQGLWEFRDNANYVRECKELYKQLLLKGVEITFVHVRGHMNIRGNEIADLLATNPESSYNLNYLNNYKA